VKSLLGMHRIMDHAEATLLARACHQDAIISPPPSSPLQRIAAGSEVCFSRFSIHIKDTLKKCSIPLEQLEVLASDRDTWRTMCNQGLTIFYSNYAADAESRRAHRHAASTSSSGATCHICGRVCASDFGLRSHLRSHTRKLS